jgi:hypothetical protein
MLQKQTADERLDDSLLELEKAIQQDIDQKRQEASKAAEAKRAKAASEVQGGTGKIDRKEPEPEPATPPEPVAPPRAVVEIMPTSVFNKISNSVYLESQSDIDQFVEALKQELEEAIANNQRVRIR